MINKLSKYITPLRIVAIWLLVLAIINHVNAEQSIKEGYELGLGGLGFMVLGFGTLIAIVLDLIISFTLKPKWNWMLQLIIVLIFIAFVIII